MRRGFFAIACAAAQVAAGPALLASAITLGIQIAGHAHSVSLVPGAGHVDLVLAHAEEHHPDRTARHDDLAASASGHSHVFHLAGDDTAGTAPRRASVPAATAVAPVALPMWSSPIPARAGLEPRARSSDSLRASVLRL